MKCQACGGYMPKLSYCIHPGTGQPVWVCYVCEGQWSELAARRPITEGDLRRM